jgi:hypothetical protein
MIDTHSHLYLEEFREDRQGMFNRAREAGVTRVYLPAINSESHEAMMETAAVSDGFCVPMMGLHPCYVEKDFTKELELVEQWLQREKFAAIGDYYDEQNDIFYYKDSPYPSWTLNSNFDWQAPTPKPSIVNSPLNGHILIISWNESILKWIAFAYDDQNNKVNFEWNSNTQNWVQV